MSKQGAELESETDYGSSPFKTVTDADKQILEWTSRLELETVQLRDKSENLFKIIKENVDELGSSRKLFEAELEKRKQPNDTKILDAISALRKRLDALESANCKSSKSLGDRIIKRVEDRSTEWTNRFAANENILLNVSQQLQDLTDVVQTLHEDMKVIIRKQDLLDRKSRHESIATPESQHQKSRVLIPWEDVQEFEMK